MTPRRALGVFLQPGEFAEGGAGPAGREAVGSEIFEAYLELAPDAVVIIDLDGRIVRVNAQTESMFGYPRDALLGNPVEMLLPERYRENHVTHRDRYIQAPGTRPMGAGLDLYGLRKDGTEFPVQISLSSFEAEGEVLAFAAVRDVTDQRRISEDRGRLAAIVDSSEDAIYSIDPQGIIMSWNPAAERLYGYRDLEIVGQFVSVLIPPSRHGEESRILTQLMAGEKVEHYETERVRKDGTVIEVALAVSPIRDLGGSIVGGSVIARDISERKRTEEILRKNEEKFRAFLELAPDAVVIIDGNGRIVLVNAQTENLFGYERAELLGEPVEQLLPHRFRDAHVHHRLGYLAEPQARPMGAGLDLFGLRKDGVEFAVDISLSPLETEEGTLLAAAIRDVTERKRLEALRDQFIANAAHELRTPMATLAMLGSTLASHLHEMSVEQIADSLAALRRQGERASTLIANLLNLSEIEGGRVELNMRNVRIADVVARALETAPHPDGVSIDVIAQEDLRVAADPLRLEQVVTNLVTNVYRYGGLNARIEASAKNASVEIAVSDDGAGVPANLIPTLFHPFTRGKTAGAVGGSGIGLALCRGLVQAMGGAIWYEPAHPRGSRFVIQLKRES